MDGHTEPFRYDELFLRVSRATENNKLVEAEPASSFAVITPLFQTSIDDGEAAVSAFLALQLRWASLVRSPEIDCYLTDLTSAHLESGFGGCHPRQTAL